MYRIMKRTLTPKQRISILRRDKYVCVYCLGRANTVDHVVPFNWSQCDKPDNLVAACGICNSIAGDLVFENFDLKKEYILSIRNTRKWLKKIRKGKKYIPSKETQNQPVVSFGEVFRRDNYQCQSCRKRFSVSKLVYYHILPENDNLENLVTLCPDCCKIIKENSIQTLKEILYYKKVIEGVKYFRYENEKLKDIKNEKIR